MLCETLKSPMFLKYVNSLPGTGTVNKVYTVYKVNKVNKVNQLYKVLKVNKVNKVAKPANTTNQVNTLTIKVIPTYPNKIHTANTINNKNVAPNNTPDRFPVHTTLPPPTKPTQTPDKDKHPPKTQLDQHKTKTSS